MGRNVNKTVEIDHGYSGIIRELRLARDSYVDVGYWGPKKHPESDGDTVVSIAATNEFGSRSDKIPERSFIRSTVDEHRTEYRNMLAQAGADIARSRGARTVKGELTAIGEHILTDIQRKITDGDSSWPPMAEATKAMRRHKGPGGVGGKFQLLLDTGTLRASVSTRVVVRGVRVAGTGAR